MQSPEKGCYSRRKKYAIIEAYTRQRDAIFTNQSIAYREPY